MAIQAKNPADNPTAGPIKTRAPAQKFVVTDRGGFAHPQRVSGYGQNQSSLPSSIPPGTFVKSDLDISPPDGDDALAAVIARGTAKVDDVNQFQNRKVAGNVPRNRDTAGASPGPSVPGTTVGGQGDPVRKPSS